VTGKSDRLYGDTHFITYSNEKEPFRTNADNYCAAALAAGFTTARHYTEADLRQTPFWAENEAILSQPRGAGYWLWKPYIILETLRNVGPNDIVVYNDAGRYLPGSFEPFPAFPHTILTLVARLPKRFIHAFRNEWFRQCANTKIDCFILMDANTDEMLHAPQLSGAPLFYMPSPEGISQIEAWLSYARDPRILTDLPASLGVPESWDFEDHRHDMAIASILAHQRKANYIDVSRAGAFKAARQVRQLYPQTPRTNTHPGYLSEVIRIDLEQRGLDVETAPLDEICKGLVINLTGDEPVPHMPRSRGAAQWDEIYANQLAADPSGVTVEMIAGVVSRVPMTSLRLNRLGKLNIEKAPFWDAALHHHAELVSQNSALTTDYDQANAQEYIIAAIRHAEALHPDIAGPLRVNMVWQVLTNENRTLYKERPKVADTLVGQAAIMAVFDAVGGLGATVEDERLMGLHNFRSLVNDAASAIFSGG